MRNPSAMSDYRSLITLQSDTRGGKPCVRGSRIAVHDVLGWLAAGMTNEQILHDYPELTREDILACLAWAAAREHRAAWIPAAA
jgi:uncharacterized protein (DUF433 family)